MSAVVEEDRPILKATASGDAAALAQAIRRSITENPTTPPQIRAIGHGAIGQGIKAVAIARGWLASQGLDLSLRPGMVNMADPKNEGGEITVVVLNLHLVS